MINNRNNVSKIVRCTKPSSSLIQYRTNTISSINDQADAQYKKNLKRITKEISNDLTEYLTPMPNYFNKRHYEKVNRHINEHNKLSLSIKKAAVADNDEMVSIDSIIYTQSPELKKVSIGWDSNYDSLMSEFLDVYKSVENCGHDVPRQVINKVNNFFNHQLPANYLTTFFAYSFKAEINRANIRKIVNILINTYTRSNVNNFERCSGNIVDNIIFNHLSCYDSKNGLSGLASALEIDTERVSRVILLDTIEKYIHRLEFLGDFEMALRCLSDLLENCLDNKIPISNINIIQRCLSLIGKGIVIHKKSHFAPRSRRNPFNPWMKLNSILLSCKINNLTRYNLEQFTYQNVKNHELYIEQLKNIISDTDWKVIDPDNLTGGSIIEFLGIENPEILDDYITSQYLNTDKAKNLSLNNDVLKSVCMTYCQIYDVHKAVDTVDVLLKHNSRELDSMGVLDVSYKIPYTTIMGYLLDDIMTTIIKTANVKDCEASEKPTVYLDMFTKSDELNEKYQMFMGIQQIIVNKNLESKSNYSLIGDVNNLSGHVRILFDSYLGFLKFMDYQSEKMNLDFIEYFKSALVDELKGAAGIEYKGFEEVMHLFHSILYHILPRLSNVEVGEEFIDFFYNEILIKHCLASKETKNYEKDAEVYKMVLKEKFDYHASTREVEQGKDQEPQLESIVETL
ncbi:hypothetical protein ACO0R3_000663 [Hanseniaspora guilliermondii]